MRSVILLMLGLGGLLLAAVSSAEEYAIVDGNFTDAATGESVALSGSLEIDPLGVPLGDDSVFHLINDFELQAGDETFLPSLPAEFDGKVPILFLRVADQILFSSGQARLFHVRAGGELVEVNGDEVTFRYFDFDAGSAIGPLVTGSEPGAEPPQRFNLQGTVYRVDQTFRIDEGTCPPILIPPPTLPPGGGVIIHGGASIFDRFEVFDLSMSETAQFIPAPGGAVLTRVTVGSQSSINGTIRIAPSADIYFANPSSVFFGQTQTIDDSIDFAVTHGLTISTASTHPVPTLEELNITAPDGAVITFEAGLLSIVSEGDLTLFGPFPEIDGFTALSVVTTGSIFVLEAFEVPALDTIVFNAGGSVVIDGDILPPVPVPPCDVLTLAGLRPIFPAEKTEIGSFALAASSATQVEIDVLPWRDPNRLHLGTRQRVSVAVLGSDDFDVRDIDPDTLRLGPAAGEPLTRRGRPIAWIFDVDRTRPRHRDLFTIFDLRTLGVAYTDTELCLSAATYAGETIEGCDEIDAMPRMRPNKHHRRHNRADSKFKRRFQYHR